MRQRRLHLLVGLVSLLAFLGTGWVMRDHRPTLSTLDNATRLLFRSRHIYLLWSALLNLVLGLYLDVWPQKVARVLQRIGSGLVVVAPGPLLAAFVHDPGVDELKHAVARYGIFASFGGVMLQVIASVVAGRGSPTR